MLGGMGDEGEPPERPWLRTFAQLEAGQSRAEISRRTKSGAYRRVLCGVYADREVSGLDRCRAVGLWRADATFSHLTAAWLWGLVDEPASVYITVPPNVRVRGPGWLTIARREVPEAGWVFDLPIVTRPWAVVESLPLLDRAVGERLLDEFVRSDEQYEQLRECCAAGTGRRGIAEARGMVERASRRTASEAERVVHRGLAAAGYRLAANRSVGKYYGDIVDEWSRVVVEIDGWSFHSERSVFRKDRRRQNRLLLDGWLVLRYAADDVFAEPEVIVREIVAVVARRQRARR